jgi:uncharacterized BrkB/YihY/UPF0761 family membrane protein
LGEWLDQTARRGAEAPLQVSVACSFLFLGGLLLFLATGLFCFFERPPTGVKSKRIFLSADAAFTAARWEQLSNQFGSYLTVVLLFSARL